MVKKDLLGNIPEKLWCMKQVSQVMNINLSLNENVETAMAQWGIAMHKIPTLPRHI